ncbi:MAG: hypothetical protein ABI846_02850 [Rudaea sp.]
MRNWLEQIHTLSASLLFTQGHLLPPAEQVPAPPRRARKQPASVIERCAEACRGLVRWPRLIQPH